MNNKKRSASSNRWLDEHFKDRFVKQAQKKNYVQELVLNLKKFSKPTNYLNGG